MRLTKLNIDKLVIPSSSPFQAAQKRYYDDKLKGFGIRLTSGGSKAFFVEKRINNKLRRITIGRYGELTPEQARKEAQKLLGQIATGIDPTTQKQFDRNKKITLLEAFQDYKLTRKSLKSKTLYDYEKTINLAFGNWRNKPLTSITKDDVSKQHDMLGKDHGRYYANRAMTLLRAIFNFAKGQYDGPQGYSLISENPVDRLTKTKAWFPEKPRRTLIRYHQLSQWYPAVLDVKNTIIRDWLLFLLFTGLRSTEAATLKWESIDFKDKSMMFKDTKNNQPHSLPITSFLYEILMQRQKNRKNEYVFYGNGRSGHMINPKKQIIEITKKTGIIFTPHDIRRTFITIAESLDIPHYSLKMLLNHKTKNKDHDITSQYIIGDVERLRNPMQKITNYLLGCLSGIPTSDELVLNTMTEDAINMYLKSFRMEKIK